MSSQKALILLEKQGNWKLGESKIPTPGPKDVLVKITATALNPVDWKIRVWGFLATEFPFVSGTDGAGVVEAVGSEVTNVATGDRIFFQGHYDNDHATFQQYCIVPAELTAKIPSNISADQAASIPLGLATVVTGLWGHHPDAKSANLPAPWEEHGLTKFANKPAFIVGGASSVGQYAIQMAKLSKHSPIITTASPHNEALLKSLGATHVINRSLSHEQILDEIKKITGGAPIEYVFDAISSADTQTVAYDAVAHGGTVVLVMPELVPESAKKADDGKKVITVWGFVQTPENRQVGVELYKRLTEWLENGVLVPNRVEVLSNGLASIPDGLDRLQADKVSGFKLVARPQETA